MKNTNTALSRIKLVLHRNNCKRDNLKTIIWIPLKWPKKKKECIFTIYFRRNTTICSDSDTCTCYVLEGKKMTNLLFLNLSYKYRK